MKMVVIKNEIGNFDCVIPPSPFPQDVKSSRAIFKLKSFFVINQGSVVGTRVSGDANEDVCGFYVEINGAGLNQGIQSQVRPTCNLNTQAFPIYNKDAGALNATSNIFQRNSGGNYYGDDVLCSNPYGTIFHIRVFTMEDNNADVIVDNVNLRSVITFSIELIPDN